MTTPGTHDFEIVVGTTDPFVFRLKVSDGGDPPVLSPMELTDVRMSIKSGSAAPVTYSLEDGDFELTDVDEGEYTFQPTPAQTRLLKTGVNDEGLGKNTYELEIRNANLTPPTQMVYLVGRITATGGINQDD